MGVRDGARELAATHFPDAVLEPWRALALRVLGDRWEADMRPLFDVSQAPWFVLRSEWPDVAPGVRVRLGGEDQAELLEAALRAAEALGGKRRS
jgi:hypothetical protein